MKIYITIIFFIISTILLSCNFNGNQSSHIQKIKNTGNKENISSDGKLSFIDELRKNRECMTDSQRADILVSGTFFDSKLSEKDKYILYFNYLLEHSYEGFDEAITQYTYNMFKKYPSKFSELDSYILFLNKRQKEVVLCEITSQLSYELVLRDSITKVSETDFEKMFPFLKEHDCVKYFTKIKNENLHK